jgi:hypothetical protein
MGRTLKTLVEIKLPPRESHNSRALVDLCENIHIHYREWRQVFTLPEWLEFVTMLTQAARDVRNYLAQNPDYREGEWHNTLMVANAGLARLIKSSPAPNQSTYFDRTFAVEIMHPSMRDEMHVHWRDYRFVLPRSHFRQIADAFTEARVKLDEWDEAEGYPESHWRTRSVDAEIAAKAKLGESVGPIGGEVQLSVGSIQPRESSPRDAVWVGRLVELYRAGEWVAPVVVSTEPGGGHAIIDGNHRLTAAKEAGAKTINAVVVPITFEQSKMIRQAENLCKKFDREVRDDFELSSFFREWLAWKLGTHWEGHFAESKRLNKRVKR